MVFFQVEKFSDVMITLSEFFSKIVKLFLQFYDSYDYGLRPSLTIYHIIELNVKKFFII
jgi:hypothetical protein